MSSFTPEDLTFLAGFMRDGLRTELATLGLIPAAVPLATPAVPANVLSFDASPVKANATVTPEMLAKDATDPERSEYTLLARPMEKEARRTLYVKLWTAERNRLLAAGVGKASGKQAQANYQARLDAERARLKARDGITGRMAPVISAESRRSSGVVSDPTANMAIANVDREARIAALKSALAAERGTDVVLSRPIKERSAASERRSAAQKAAGSSPFEHGVAKLVRDAMASKKPRDFIIEWRKAHASDHLGLDAIVAKKATVACQRLGIPVKA